MHNSTDTDRQAKRLWLQEAFDFRTGVAETLVVPGVRLVNPRQTERDGSTHDGNPVEYVSPVVAERIEIEANERIAARVKVYFVGGRQQEFYRDQIVTVCQA